MRSTPNPLARGAQRRYSVSILSPAARSAATKSAAWAYRTSKIHSWSSFSGTSSSHSGLRKLRLMPRADLHAIDNAMIERARQG